MKYGLGKEEIPEFSDRSNLSDAEKPQALIVHDTIYLFQKEFPQRPEAQKRLETKLNPEDTELWLDAVYGDISELTPKAESAINMHLHRFQIINGEITNQFIRNLRKIYAAMDEDDFYFVIDKYELKLKEDSAEDPLDGKGLSMTPEIAKRLALLEEQFRASGAYDEEE